MTGTLLIVADNQKDAIEIARSKSRPVGYYVSGSFELNTEYIEENTAQDMNGQDIMVGNRALIPVPTERYMPPQYFIGFVTGHRNGSITVKDCSGRISEASPEDIELLSD